MESITAFPRGKVIGSARLTKDDQVIDMTRIKYGSRTRFVEKVRRVNRYGDQLITALRKTDDFPSDKIADRWIGEWLQGREHREYALIHKDPGFHTIEG